MIDYDKDAKKWVSDWLFKCQERQELPWEFDFKRFFLPPDTQQYQMEFCNDPLKFQLAYKFGLLPNRTYKQKFSNKEFSECDKIASPIYQVLGWHTSPDDHEVGGDTMNSFKTTFTRLLSTSSKVSPFYDKNEKTWNYFYRETPRLDAELIRWGLGISPISLKSFPAFQLNQYRLSTDNTHTDLLREITRFATLTETIGNFIVNDREKNKNRPGQNLEYWDAYLNNLKGKGTPEDLKKLDLFVQHYYLKGYVHSGSSIGPLWDDHENNFPGFPKNIGDFEQFYLRSNQLITARGKLITKQLIEKLGLTDKLPFYKEYHLDEISADCDYDDIISDKTV